MKCSTIKNPFIINFTRQNAKRADKTPTHKKCGFFVVLQMEKERERKRVCVCVCVSPWWFPVSEIHSTNFMDLSCAMWIIECNERSVVSDLWLNLICKVTWQPQGTLSKWISELDDTDWEMSGGVDKQINERKIEKLVCNENGWLYGWISEPHLHHLKHFVFIQHINTRKNGILDIKTDQAMTKKNGWREYVELGWR